VPCPESTLAYRRCTYSPPGNIKRKIRGSSWLGLVTREFTGKDYLTVSPIPAGSLSSHEGFRLPDGGIREVRMFDPDGDR